MSEIKLADVAVRLGGRLVLSDVQLAIGAGEFLGIVGPNGAGKTTLLRAIQGLLPLAAGRIELGTTTIGYVPQRHDFAWDYPVSVAHVVLTGLVRKLGWGRGPQADDWRAVASALELVDMKTLHQRPIGELSGGQRQRVLVARALVTNPSALLLDEPFTGLDLPTQELLTGLFERLALTGTTVVMTTHDLASARHTCSRLCIVNRTIVADSAHDDLDDAQKWIDAFGISPGSPILATLGLTPPTTSEPRLEEVPAC